MGDYITDRHTAFKVCPKCHKSTYIVQEWTEHLEGWGFQDYKTEHFRRTHCNNCGYSGEDEEA